MNTIADELPEVPPPHVPDNITLPDTREPASEETDAPGRGAVRLIALIFGLTACWLASDLLVPIMLAATVALLCNPIVSRLTRLWVPRWLGALVVILGGLALSLWLFTLLVTPASDWVKQAPAQLRELAPKLKQLTRQVEKANKAAASIATATGATASPQQAAAEAAPRMPSLWSFVTSAPRALASALAVILLAYFFVVYGEDVQRHAIARLPGAQQKQLTIDILRTIESDLSTYVLTISVINLALGAILGGALFWLGLDLSDALLWGTVAALFNFVPYVGPLAGMVLLAVVGVVAFDTPAQMLAPPAIYLGLHALESQFVTPVVLGKRMAISPLVVLLWLMLWGFLWGIAGLLLAVPMLASLKIVAERVEGWQGWAKVIE